MLRLGIVGLPNVGKSTLFNALTSANVLAANYPFATKDPNVGRVNVPDARLDALAKVVQPRGVLPAAVEFVDIAGLVKGASQGEGLGNQFLANIRETDAIVHVIRAFDDDDVLHVMGAIDSVRDREVIEFELALADLSVVEKRLDRAKRASRTGDKDALAELGALERAFAPLQEGRALWHAALSAEDRAVLAPLSLLTLKPILYAANVTDAELSGDEGPHLERLREAVASSGEPAEVVPFSAKIEAELAELPAGGPQCISRVTRVGVGGTRPPHSRRLSPARSADLLHRRGAGGPRMDDPSRGHCAAGGGGDPYRLRARLHSRRDGGL